MKKLKKFLASVLLFIPCVIAFAACSTAAQHEHTFGEWTVTLEPTCEQAGEETRTCSMNSAHTETRSIDMLGHDYGDWVIVKNPTELKEGLKERRCSHDSTHVIQESIPALGTAAIDALKDLLSVSPDVWEYIPAGMRPGANLTANITQPDYSDFLNTSVIPQGGFGEQWKMVTDNLNQATFFIDQSVSVISGVATAITTGYELYFDQNPNDDTYISESGAYKYQYKYTAGLISLTIEWGDAQIFIQHDTARSERVTRLQLNDANAIKLVQTPNMLVLALRYGGVRRAYFQIEKDTDDLIKGYIYEFLGIDNVYSIASNANFYVTPTYTTAVGNKASSNLPLFKGVISETYSTAQGKMLGYETNETLSLVEYDTVYYDANYITGWDSIKYDTAEKKWYVNESANEFVEKKVGGFSLKMGSRRYMLEMRIQYFYYKDINNDIAEIAIEVPMIGIQEDQIDTFTADVDDANDGLTFTVNRSSEIEDKIQSDYDIYVPLYKELNDLIGTEDILEYIGTKNIIQD